MGPKTLTKWCSIGAGRGQMTLQYVADWRLGPKTLSDGLLVQAQLKKNMAQAQSFGNLIPRACCLIALLYSLSGPIQCQFQSFCPMRRLLYCGLNRETELWPIIIDGSCLPSPPLMPQVRGGRGGVGTLFLLVQLATVQPAWLSAPWLLLQL